MGDACVVDGAEFIVSVAGNKQQRLRPAAERRRAQVQPCAMAEIDDAIGVKIAGQVVAIESSGVGKRAAAGEAADVDLERAAVERIIAAGVDRENVRDVGAARL